MPSKRFYNVSIKKLPTEKLLYKELPSLQTLPQCVDLRSKCPPVYDQGELGSCTANALAAAYEFDEKNTFAPSRLFIYYNERVLEGSVSEDSGALISDGIKTLQKYGVCPENMWPYNVSQFTKQPSYKCYNNALNNKALVCKNIQQNLTAMKTALASGFPFVCGISVYEKFESEEVAKTGIVSLPDINNEKSLGGHAVLCVGYDDNKHVWIMRNSWGPLWGMNGYFTLPYEYLINPDLSSELWNISKISTVQPSKIENSLDSSNKLTSEIENLKLKIDILACKLDKILEKM